MINTMRCPTRDDYRKGALRNLIPGCGSGYRVVNRPDAASWCGFLSLALLLGPSYVIVPGFHGNPGIFTIWLLMISGVAVFVLINIPTALHLFAVGMLQPKD